MLEGQRLQPLAARLPRDAAHATISMQVRACEGAGGIPHREEVKRTSGAWAER